MAWSDRLFRVLVRLLPEEFRAGYAREMEATFRAERDEARHLRRTGQRRRLMFLWVKTVIDILRTAPGEHLDVLARDLRFAFRTMAARPLHTGAALLTLAIGIGANVAMFSVVDAVLLRPLPYRDPAGLVTVSERSAGDDSSTTGYLSFVDLRERTRSFTHLVATGSSTATLTGDGLDADRVNAMRVSRGYFDMLGVPPILGRTFQEAEDAPGAARRVVVLSEPLWRRRFNADPSVIGRAILVGDLPHTVVGVMPASFEDLVAARLYRGAELWYPLGYDPAAPFACRTCRHLRAFGRLAPGVTPEAAARDASSVLAELEREHPTQYHEASAEVTPLAEFFLGPVRPVLLVLWAGVAVLLLVACSNVANLVLLRASERSQEVAVRTALGVTRGRLARQLLTESLLLALLGGLAGLVPAWLAVRAIALAGPAEIPRIVDVGLDGRALAVALGVAILSGIAFGLIPLMQLLRRDIGETIQGAGRRTVSAGTWRMRAALVTGNVALAALLLVGSGLLVRSLASLLAVEPGFEASRALTMEMALGGAKYRFGNEPEKEIAAAAAFYDELLQRVMALPGVESAGATTTLPLGGSYDRSSLHIEGRPHANPEEAPSADRFAVTPRFLETLGIPLVRGRRLTEADAQGAASVAVVNRRLADELFPGEDPVGHRISLGPPTAPRRTIVGVVGDIQHDGLDVPPGYQVYVPQAQWAWAETNMTIVVRARDEGAALLAGPIRAIVRELDPAQPVTAVQLYSDIIAASTGTRRFAAGLLGVFAATALLMAVVGLYGALAVMVGQRRREIGVRVALGAGAREIRRMVLGQGMRPALAGLALGLAAAAVSVRVLASLLYGIELLDPLTFVGAALTLLVCAIAACLLPAWRASSVDAAQALRAE